MTERHKVYELECICCGIEAQFRSPEEAVRLWSMVRQRLINPGNPLGWWCDEGFCPACSCRWLARQYPTSSR